MFLEVHLLQNFALSNLNRDDTGAPKSCIFAGTRRARISSQCLKRAVRTVVREEQLVPSENLAYRTKKIVDLLSRRLIEKNLESEQAKLVALNAIEGIGFEINKDKTKYLLMIGEQEIKKLAELCMDNLDKLNFVREEKKKASLDSKLAKELLSVLDGGNAVDMALFGRMIADHADKNIDAAVQMAHALSTNVIANEFDFFSAVDDLQLRSDESGAGAAHIDTMLYNSSCYYRYANVDISQLLFNLGNKADLTQQAINAFIEGMVKAVPTGKQTSAAAQNPPAFILCTVRDVGLWSLANAFTTPVGARYQEDMVTSSAEKLTKHWNQLIGLYGPTGIVYSGYATYLEGLGKPENLSRESNFSELKKRVLEAVQFEN
ncbi:MAG: type I-E CRISPR-associated protein Cas7/Cse4/CasC [Lawsonibacter sp.]|jgi:CRISPR system Cascade subunit CasC